MSDAVRDVTIKIKVEAQEAEKGLTEVQKAAKAAGDTGGDTGKKLSEGMKKAGEQSKWVKDTVASIKKEAEELGTKGPDAAKKLSEGMKAAGEQSEWVKEQVEKIRESAEFRGAKEGIDRLSQSLKGANDSARDSADALQESAAGFAALAGIVGIATIAAQVGIEAYNAMEEEQRRLKSATDDLNRALDESTKNLNRFRERKNGLDLSNLRADANAFRSALALEKPLEQVAQLNARLKTLQNTRDAYDQASTRTGRYFEKQIKDAKEFDALIRRVSRLDPVGMQDMEREKLNTFGLGGFDRSTSEGFEKFNAGVAKIREEFEERLNPAIDLQKTQVETVRDAIKEQQDSLERIRSLEEYITAEKTRQLGVERNKLQSLKDQADARGKEVRSLDAQFGGLEKFEQDMARTLADKARAHMAGKGEELTLRELEKFQRLGGANVSEYVQDERARRGREAGVEDVFRGFGADERRTKAEEALLNFNNAGGEARLKQLIDKVKEEQDKKDADEHKAFEELKKTLDDNFTNTVDRLKQTILDLKAAEKRINDLENLQKRP